MNMDLILIYLAKVSGILALFLGTYLLLLRRETFFKANRHFLLGGIVISFLLPFVEIKKYVLVESVVIPEAEMIQSGSVVPAIAEQGPDWALLLSAVYISGLIFLGLKFLMQLYSLHRLLRNHEVKRIGDVRYVETDQDLAPFSFFNYIVYNPSQFSESELDAIRQHERAHCTQAHSVDMLLAHLLTVLLWLNPLSWLYKRHIQQNLEFLADSSAIRQTKSVRNYQYALLKVSSNIHHTPITNPFYSSLIKKRIVMLHKSKSNRLHALKYAFILPLLAGFLFAFNTRVVAQEKEKEMTVEVKISRIEILIDKDYSKEQIEADTKFMKEQGIDLKFKGIKRNKAGEITAISGSYKDENGISGNYSQNSDTPIKPFTFRVTGEGEDRSIGFFSGASHHTIHSTGKNYSKMIVVDTDADDTHDGKHKVHKRILMKGDEDGAFNWTSDGDGDEMKVLVEVKDGEKVITVNEMEITEDELKALGENGDGKRIKIKKIHKGEGANVFILKDSDDEEDIEIIEKGGASFFFMDSEKGENPLFIVDGKEMSKEEFEGLSPSKIEKVEVIKGEKATEEYGDKAKDGVIKISTKKN